MHGLISGSPMEGGHENNFLRRIALRTIEPRSRLGFAEDVRNAVITDAVARSKVGVGVVVERAPPNAAGILRIGSELIVHTRVADCMLCLPLHSVDALGRIGVTDELRVQITRVVWLQHGPAKIVHREHIFQKLRGLEVANASGLTTRIKLVSYRVCLSVEVVIVERLVDSNAPQNNGRMIPIATNHALHIIHGDLLPGLIADMLPPRNLFENKQANAIALVEEMAGLRVVRSADNVALDFVAQYLSIA